MNLEKFGCGTLFSEIRLILSDLTEMSVCLFNATWEERDHAGTVPTLFIFDTFAG